VLLLILAGASPAQLTNRLAGHPSPYLAMHGKDPVHWQDWGPEVLRLAEAENKLVFISSGYFACHWCHVMQRESYHDPAIAKLLNRHFIAVKLDRELHPALDAHLIAFVERTQGHAGWPLNVFLTPAGHPLVGLTYAPPAKFRELLQRLAETWATEADALKDVARRAAAELGAETASPGASPDLGALRIQLSAEALELGDELQGGFGRQSRFPMIPQLLALLELLEIQPDARLLNLLQLTLDQMASQGLRDHLGGGFFRYTVDPGWQVPHYEKMLYTNAMMVGLYLRAARILERPAYREVAKETLEFALRELRGSDGGFIASLSAVDALGVEGGAYLWGADELERLLSPDELAAAQQRWRLHGTPPTEGGYLPVLDETATEVSPALLESARTKLMKSRSQRSLPRDDKELAAWNGLMLSALAEAAAAFGDPRYVEAGQALERFLTTRLWDGQRLLRARSGSAPVGSASLEDYAYVSKGLTDWASHSGDQSDLLLAARLVEDAWKRFYVEDAWQDSDDLLLPGQTRVRASADGPMPSPSAVLIGVSLELSSRLSLPELARKARQALGRSYAVSAGDPFWHAGHTMLLLSAAQQR